MKVSIVIPVYNEMDTLADILIRVRKAPLPDGMDREIILIDDCSTDGTRDLLKEFEKQGEKVLYHDVNRGKGAALRTGFEKASGEIILVQDADLEYNPDEYGQLLEPIIRGEADIVYGSRFLGDRGDRNSTAVHAAGNRLLTKASNFFSELNLTDMETCYKVFRRDVIEDLDFKENRFGIEPEFTAKIAEKVRNKEAVLKEVPISYKGRTYKEGKKIGIQDALRAFWCIAVYNSTRRARLFRLAVRFLPIMIVLILHFSILIKYHAPAIADPDANGYYAQGTRLFTTGKASFRPESDVEYIGMHWLLAEDGTYYSRYSPGFGTIIGLLYSVFGYKGGAAANLLLASLTLVGLYMILKRSNGWGYASVGILVLAFTPLFNSHALMGFAHIAVMCFLTWGLYFLLRWRENRTYTAAVTAGILLGMVPVIRYPEALFAIGIGTFLLWDVRSKKGNWKQVLACCGGACVPVLFLLIRNQMAFGAFWRTAYDLTNEQTGFGWKWFTEHFAGYIRDFTNSGMGLFFGFGLAGMILMCFDSEKRREGVLYILLIVPTTLLYMAYYWAGRGDSSMRFLLPLFVCVLIPGIWFLRKTAVSLKKYQAGVLTGVLIIVHVIWGDFGIENSVYQMSHKKKVYAAVTQLLVGIAQDGDVIISDQGILQNLDYVRRWKLADLQKIMNSGRNRRAGRLNRNAEEENTPSPRQAAKDEAFRKTFEGLSDFERETIIADQLDDWAGDRDVWFVGDPEELESLNGVVFHRNSFEILGTVSLPEYSAPEGKGSSRDRRMRDFTRRMRAPQDGPPGMMGQPPFPGMNPQMAQRFARRRPGGGLMGPVTMKECVIAKWKYGEK